MRQNTHLLHFHDMTYSRRTAAHVGKMFLPHLRLLYPEPKLQAQEYGADELA